MRRAAALLMPGQRAKEAKPTPSEYGDNSDALGGCAEEEAGVGQSSIVKKTPGRKRKIPAAELAVDIHPLAPPTAQQPGGKRARRVSSPNEVRERKRGRNSLSKQSLFFIFFFSRHPNFFFFQKPGPRLSSFLAELPHPFPPHDVPYRICSKEQGDGLALPPSLIHTRTHAQLYTFFRAEL